MTLGVARIFFWLAVLALFGSYGAAMLVAPGFYAVFYLQPAKTAWMPERVVAYNQAGHRIAECWATTGEGNVCDRPPGAPQPP
jgi:hypothetical protein